MIRILVFLFLFTTTVFAEDECTYKTEQVIEDGKVIKVIEYKSCVETEKLNKQNFLVSFATKPEFERSFIIVVMALLENL